MTEKIGFTKSGRKCLIQTFSRLDEMWSFVNQSRDKQKHKKWDKNDSYSVFEDKHFVGGLTDKTEVEKYLVEGWSEPVSKIQSLIEENIKKVQIKRKSMKYVNDVHGFVPIVPNALKGLPQSMINSRVSSKKQKVVHFLVEVQYNFMTKQRQVFDYFAKLVAYIYCLEQEGYRCRIETFMSFSECNSDKTIVGVKTCVKSENQLFDIKRMTFILAHCGFFRTVGFMWESVLDLPSDEYHCSGLGNPLKHWNEKNKKELLDFIGTNSNAKLVYVPWDINLEEMFKKGGKVYE